MMIFRIMLPAYVEIYNHVYMYSVLKSREISLFTLTPFAINACNAKIRELLNIANKTVYHRTWF